MTEDTGGQPMKRVVVTADDLGLSEEINRGIIEAHREGLVTTASLLVNAPATAHALELVRANPRLQVGLHWSVVEGLCLLGRPCSLTSARPYLPGGICLHADWRDFVWRMATGRIRVGELALELEQQALAFERLVGPIPFANATQHLHLFPGVAGIVLALAERHGIPYLRLPRRFGDRGAGAARAGAAALLGVLSRRARRRAIRGGRRAPDTCLGFASSGRLREAELIRLLRDLPPGLTELIVHPGRDCPALRAGLPGSYGQFDWEGERAALVSAGARAALAAAGGQLGTFAAAGRSGNGGA